MPISPPKPWSYTKSYIKLQSTSKRLTVRPLKLSDYHNWKLAHEGRLPSLAPFDDPDTPESELDRSHFKELVESAKRGARAQVIYGFGVFELESGAFIGHTNLFVMTAQLSWANLGYGILNQYWGHGYASEAAALTLKIAFESLLLYRVEASCEKENTASAKVALKAGLMSEGERLKFFPDNGGVDMYVFAQNAYDYAKSQNN